MTPTWTDYLDAVEAAALDIKASLLEGRAPAMPALVLPAGPPPEQSVPRRDAVAALLAQVTEMLGQHRDEVTRQLATLPRQAARSGAYHAVDAGAKLDVMS
jgi:hypothetical protein